MIAGALAKLITPGPDPGGVLVTIVIGIVGAVLGGFVASLLGIGGIAGFDLRSLVIAIIGAVLLLVLLRAIRTVANGRAPASS